MVEMLRGKFDCVCCCFFVFVVFLTNMEGALFVCKTSHLCNKGQKDAERYGSNKISKKSHNKKNEKRVLLPGIIQGDIGRSPTGILPPLCMDHQSWRCLLRFCSLGLRRSPSLPLSAFASGLPQPDKHVFLVHSHNDPDNSQMLGNIGHL